MICVLLIWSELDLESVNYKWRTYFLSPILKSFHRLREEGLRRVAILSWKEADLHTEGSTEPRLTVIPRDRPCLGSGVSKSGVPKSGVPLREMAPKLSGSLPHLESYSESCIGLIYIGMSSDSPFSELSSDSWIEGTSNRLSGVEARHLVTSLLRDLEEPHLAFWCPFAFSLAFSFITVKLCNI